MVKSEGGFGKPGTDFLLVSNGNQVAICHRFLTKCSCAKTSRPTDSFIVGKEKVENVVKQVSYDVL